jgi:malonyl CoA-acyl carrier protein transacylase
MYKVDRISKKLNKNYMALFFLVIVILANVWIYFHNDNIKFSIVKIESDIKKYELIIDEIKKNKRLQIARLLEINKNVIIKYKSTSQISIYINYMNDIQDKYNINFKWFSLNNWKISSSVIAISDKKWIAYQKAKKFLKDYRKDTTRLFDLEFVNKIKWMDNVQFKVNFKIKK